MSIGVDVSIKANLGTTPISCPPYVFSLAFPLTMGATTVIMNMVLIILQIILLRRDYKWIQLAQIIAACIFGLFIDLNMPLLAWIHVSNNYLIQWTLCLLSCFIMGFGVFLEVRAKIIYLAGEGLSLAIANVFQIKFGKAKVYVDVTLLIIGVMSSFVLLQCLKGAREGTVASALLVGTIAQFYNKYFTFVGIWLDN